MKCLAFLLCLFLATSALPQLGEQMEAKMVGGLFNKFCGASSAQPTCTCPDASTFTHPYYFAYCAETSPAREGEEPTSCTCPSGAAFPANQEELTAMMG